MASAESFGTNSRLRHTITANIGEFADLPAPEERWRFGETDLSRRAFALLREAGAIERVGREGDYFVWQTDRSIYQFIQRWRDSTPLLPCGHRPFSTVSLDSERPYSCTRDECDARYTRADIEEVLGE